MHMEETRKPARKPRAPATTRPAAKVAAPAKAAVRKKAVKPSPPVMGASPVEREQRIRMAAYFRAQRRGFAPGHDWEDWLAAEAEVTALEAPAAVLPARKTAARKKSTAA
jgi:hypothetical protein